MSYLIRHVAVKLIMIVYEIKLIISYNNSDKINSSDESDRGW